MKKNNFSVTRMQRWLFAFLMVALPYHSFAIIIIGDTFPFVKMWKELIICILYILFIGQIVLKYLHTKQVYKMSIMEYGIYTYIIVLFGYVIFSGNIFKAAYIGRIYMIPLLLGSIVKNMELSKTYLRKLLNLIMVNSIILCLWGIIQCQVLGDDFLIKIGYDTTTKWGPLRLNDEFYIARLGDFQRLVSTFAAPNTCGLYLTIVFIVLLFCYKKMNLNKVLVYGTLFLLLFSIILTFSRTSFVAMFVGVTIFCVTQVKWSLKKILYTGCILAVFACVFIGIDIVILSSRFTAPVWHLFTNTLNGTDTSFLGHVDSLKESFHIVKNHPFGVGMGKSGPRAKMFISNPYLTESSYYLMMFEVGILGAFLYFDIYFSAIFENIKIYKNQRQNTVFLSLATNLVLLTGFITLPYVQDFDVLTLGFSVIALQENKIFLNKIVKQG